MLYNFKLHLPNNAKKVTVAKDFSEDLKELLKKMWNKREERWEDVKQKVNLLGSATDLPIAIGFGIKDSDSALSVKDLADGIVAGSVFVDLIGEGGDTITKIANKTKELFLAIK